MDHHALAIVSITGSSLDVLGAMYLAYDLLGGEHGPLRTLTRGVTYGVIFALGYGLPLGPVFGIACGVTHGLTLALEFSRASRGEPDPGFWHDAGASAIRAIGHGVGFAWYAGPLAGALFGFISAISQTAMYRIGVRPNMDYRPACRFRLTGRQALAAVNRTIGYGIAAGILYATVGRHPAGAVRLGITIGLAMGIVTAISSSSTPLIEWAADNVPAKRMGVYGVALILAGFALQSVQYWMALLDVPIR